MSGRLGFRTVHRACHVVLTLGLLVGLGASGWAEKPAQAGFAFQGVNAPVLFIPPTVIKGPLPTFTVGAPQFILHNHIGLWRIRNTGQNFWPVPNGIPLIRDTTLATAPFLTPAGVWGIWDPPTVVEADHVIRVMELFTGLDLSAPPVGTIDLSGLEGVVGYPGLTVASFPTTAVENQPIGLDPGVNIIQNDFIGILTGTDYHTTLVESTFATLDADIAALAPGTTDPYDSQFAGATGRVVISYADVPEGDVIGFAEAVPEPSSCILCCIAGGAWLSWRYRSRRKEISRGSCRDDRTLNCRSIDAARICE